MLDVSALVLGYGGKAVVEFNGIQLAKGGQCLIAGPSGCGKTTLLYALAGLSLVMHGSVALNGVVLT